MNDEFVVIINGWEKLNPRKDVKTASWFRLNHSFFENPTFHSLTLEDRCVWIYLLCETSKRAEGGIVTVNSEHFYRVSGSNKEVLHRAVKKLQSLKLLTTRTLRGRYAHVTRTGSTERNDTERDDTLRDVTVPTPSASARGRPISAATWDAYSQAYERRYNTKPVRNKTVNGQLANFVKRLGESEAPLVAEFYVNHPNAFYVRNMHAVGVMLRDAEKLRTEWFTGRIVTQREANSVDSGGAIRSQLERIARGEL